jgi:hypothetical protein
LKYKGTLITSNSKCGIKTLSVLENVAFGKLEGRGLLEKQVLRVFLE